MSILNLFKNWRNITSEPRTRKSLQYLKIILLLILFLSLFYIIPLEDVLHVIKDTNILFFMAGILLGLLNVYLKSVRLGFLTHKQGLTISINRLFIINLIVKFYLLFLPGTIIGSGIRWGKISPKEKSTEALAAVAFNRLIDIFIIIITGLFWFLYGLGHDKLHWITAIAFFFTIGIFWILFFMFSRYMTNWIDNIKEHDSNSQKWNWFWRYLQKILISLNKYGDFNIRNIIYLFSIGILAYLVALTSYVIIAYSSGIWLSIINLGWIQAIVDLASITPLSIAGGLGIRDVSHVVLLSIYDIKTEVALAFSLLLFARTLILSLIGGIIEFIEVVILKKELA